MARRKQSRKLQQLAKLKSLEKEAVGNQAAYTAKLKSQGERAVRNQAAYTAKLKSQGEEAVGNQAAYTAKLKSQGEEAVGNQAAYTAKLKSQGEEAVGNQGAYTAKLKSQGEEAVGNQAAYTAKLKSQGEEAVGNQAAYTAKLKSQGEEAVGNQAAYTAKLKSQGERAVRNQAAYTAKLKSQGKEAVGNQAAYTAKWKSQGEEAVGNQAAYTAKLKSQGERAVRNQAAYTAKLKSQGEEAVGNQAAYTAKLKSQGEEAVGNQAAYTAKLKSQGERAVRNQAAYTERETHQLQIYHQKLTLPSTSSDMGQIISSLNDVQPGGKAEGRVMYYSIFIPPDIEHSKLTEIPIFTDKSEALRVLKQNKRARLKSFMHKSDAIEYSRCGGIKFSEIPLNNEKIFYRGPKSQDLVRFRKVIEYADFITVKRMIEENPRYLVGSGDTPSILQEGSRYNALHVAAKANSALICSYILNLVSSVEFADRLYGSCNTNHEERIRMLVDLYLNMPDKGCNETPLHFASKLGALDVVKVLVCYQQCDKTRRNKDGLTAMDIACSRAPDHLLCHKAEIVRTLGALYYIPIFRSEDNAVQPMVGHPFTPLNPPELVSPTKTLPAFEVRALAGPMTETQAKTFRKMWKTPPRTRDIFRYRPELCDPEKGLEKLGRNLAQKFQVAWKEYWQFLDSFVDLTTAEGLGELESHLKKEFKKVYEARSRNSPIELAQKTIDAELNRVAKELSSLIIDDDSDSLLTSLTMKSPDNHKDLVAISEQTTSEFDPVELTLRSESPIFFDGYHHVYRRKTKALKSITNTMENTCKIFANRIATALIQRQRSYAILDICSFQLFLAGCMTDRRFVDVDLTKGHYRLSALLKDNLLTLCETRGPPLELLFELMSLDIDQATFEVEKVSLRNLKEAVTCIGRFTVALLSCLSVECKTTGADPDILWTAAETCPCVIPSTKAPRRFPLYNSSPKSLFNNVLEDGSMDELRTFRRLSSSSCSSSGSEDFYTAPSSPFEDEAASDPDSEFMVMSETGPDLFLTGTAPTKLDKAVLDAIGDTDISPFKYPYVTLWKISCSQRSKIEPIERWPTPKPSHRRH